MRIILQVTENIQKLIDTAFSADPTNALGYGIALVVLLLSSIVFYYNWKQERKYTKQLQTQFMELNSKVLTSMKTVEIRLQDQQSYGVMLDDILDTLNTNFSLIKSWNNV